jgi:hypothetical protein
MSRLLEIHENYIKELFIFFSEEYVRLLYPKCKTKEELQLLLFNKIESVLTKYVSSDLIIEYTIRVETELDLSTRRDYIIDRILSDTTIEIEPIIIEIYYKTTKFSDIKNIKVCVKTI